MPPTLGAADPEFQLTDADFERVRTLIYQHAGIALAPAKRDMVYSRLARRLRALNLQSFSAYLQLLERNERNEWETFVNSLTTNLTYFFREAHHFETLARHLRASASRPYRIWCSAASTGEEPYSLAMTACEAFSSLSPPVTIIASDIDTQVLSVAQQGVYGREQLGKLSEERVQHFFTPDSALRNGQAKVRDELRRLVDFRRINLLDMRYALDGRFDALFCRNVMIYFDKPTQHAVLKRFNPLLRDDGLLFAGHSESFLHASELFRSLGRTVYAPVRPSVK
ncbi:MAG: chemotaxis protein CheR [Rhodocyclaceae bacterium]|nr:chemotaxis protein CheR [Rhodocyclaceae bacterium]